MVLAEAANTIQWILLGTAFACVAFLVRRGARLSQRNHASEPEAAEEEASATARWNAQRIMDSEVRLHDFAREVEARLEMRIAQLDGLVAAADREIVRLAELLKKNATADRPQGPDVVRYGSGPSSAGGRQSDDPSNRAPSGPTAAQEQIVYHLHGAGYSVPEIAHMVDRSPDDVRTILRAA